MKAQTWSQISCFSDAIKSFPIINFKTIFILWMNHIIFFKKQHKYHANLLTIIIVVIIIHRVFFLAPHNKTFIVVSFFEEKSKKFSNLISSKIQHVIFIACEDSQCSECVRFLYYGCLLNLWWIAMNYGDYYFIFVNFWMKFWL